MVVDPKSGPLLRRVTFSEDFRIKVKMDKKLGKKLVYSTFSPKKRKVNH